MKLFLTAILAFGLSACTTYIDETGERHSELNDIPATSHRYDHYNERLGEHGYDGYPYDKMRDKHCSPGHVKKSWC